MAGGTHNIQQELRDWEVKKLREWRSCGKLKADGSLRVGLEFAKRSEGRPKKRVPALTLTEICAIIR